MISIDNFDSYGAGPPDSAIWALAWGDANPAVADGAGNFGGPGTAAYVGSYYVPMGSYDEGRVWFTISAMPGTGAADILNFHFRATNAGTANAPSGNWQGYGISLTNIAAAPKYSFFKYNGTAVTNIQAATALAYAVGDIFMLTFYGSTITLWKASPGGVFIYIGSWVDTAYTSGWVGFEIFGSTPGKVNDFVTDSSGVIDVDYTKHPRLKP